MTEVDGNTRTGIQAADGSLNAVIVAGNAVTGLYHKCGAFNVVEATNQLGRQHPCGALLVTEDLNNNGGPQKITWVA
jgi:hypothetical protein